MKNRHIGLQILNAADEIRRQQDDGWFSIDTLSDSDNDDPTIIQNGAIKLRFARLNGDGISKWFSIIPNGNIVILGEIKS